MSTPTYRILRLQVGEDRARVLASIVEGIERLFAEDALLSCLAGEEILGALAVIVGRQRRRIMDASMDSPSTDEDRKQALALLWELDMLYEAAQAADPDPPKVNPNALAEIVKRLTQIEADDVP